MVCPVQCRSDLAMKRTVPCTTYSGVNTSGILVVVEQLSEPLPQLTQPDCNLQGYSERLDRRQTKLEAWSCQLQQVGVHPHNTLNTGVTAPCRAPSAPLRTTSLTRQEEWSPPAVLGPCVPTQ